MKKMKNCLVLMIAVSLFSHISLGTLTAHAEEADVLTVEVPAWVKTITLKGDLRLRYEIMTKDETGQGTPDRSRGRLRARIGIGAKISDDIKIGIGIASGGDNPRTTNQTFDDSFSTKGLQLDYAFAEVKVSDPLTVFGGKFARKKAVWHPSDLLWDGDITVEGVSLSLKKASLFFNAAGLILEEEGKHSDPSIYLLQPGINIESGNLSLKAALSYYFFNSVQGGQIDHSSNSNSLIDPSDPENSGLLYDYDALTPSVEISVKEPMGDVLPHAALFAEYVNNPDPSDENTGFLVGFKVGDQKVRKARQWQFKYMYRKLEKDAWLDALPDSDFAGGKTGYKGHELIAEVGLRKNVIFGADYYITEEIDGSKEETILQVDIGFKF